MHAIGNEQLRSFYQSVDSGLTDEHRALLNESMLEAFAEGASNPGHPAHAHVRRFG